VSLETADTALRQAVALGGRMSRSSNFVPRRRPRSDTKGGRFLTMKPSSSRSSTLSSVCWARSLRYPRPGSSSLVVRLRVVRSGR
jgi:hypothetical protein